MFPSDLGRSYTLQSFLETKQGQRPRDRVPEGLDRIILQDEASIVSLDGDRACFKVITRTAAGEELSMGPWSFLVGRQTVVWPTAPEVQVFDYAYTGERTKLDLSIFGAQAGGALRITEPADRVFRVVERTQEVCGGPVFDKKGRVLLRVELTGVHRYDEDYSESFRWLVQ
ncbi:MAG: hypothetical protein JXX28_00140 [Deltaproteobacteria bacterium]|nr:hypothetical protein [Deltaproteobacteria bacterium]